MPHFLQVSVEVLFFASVPTLGSSIIRVTFQVTGRMAIRHKNYLIYDGERTLNPLMSMAFETKIENDSNRAITARFPLNVLKAT